MATKKPTRPRTELAVPEFDKETLDRLRSKDMEERANALVDMLGNTLPAIPASFRYSIKDQDRVKNAFDFTFQLIGGQPAFAMWAAQNPDQFYKLFARMIPPQNIAIQANGPLTIVSNVPSSTLNSPPDEAIDVDVLEDDCE